MGFKKDFIWGAATSAYQIEGAAYEDGKGLNIWDTFCTEPGKIYGGQSGDVACDHYHRYEEDVQLMKQLGLKAYRFSLNWARIIPDGTGKVNEAGVDFYNKLINTLIENGIEPFITLYHWELPYELHKQGGWLNPASVKWFSEYAGVVAERFSDRVTNFFTMNEPQCFIGLGYGSGVHAPGLKMSARDTLAMSVNVLKANGAAILEMRARAKKPIKIGYAPTSSMHYPASDRPEDIEATKQALFSMNPDPNGWTWNISWWSDPVILGAFPEDGLRYYHNLLPKITAADTDLIHQKLDFYGQNIYNGVEIRMGADGKPEFMKRHDGYPKTALNWPVTPKCLRYGPKFLCERYNLPLYITENGLSCHDVISLDGKVHDPNRIDFLNRYLLELRACAESGADIAGYFQWSLMDNFEWHSGYEDRFGLVYVDYRDQKRIIKDSGYWYRDMIKENGETL